MKCIECGYNFSISLNVCPKCRTAFSAGSSDGNDNPQSFSLFEEDEPFVLDEEIVDGYSFHGKPAGQSSSHKTNDPSGKLPVLAGFGRRALAFFIDISIVLAVSFFAILIALQASGIDIKGNFMKPTYFLLPVFLILILFASTLLLFLHAYSGKSFGKLIFGLRVVGEDGRGITLGQSFTRWVGYYLSALPVLFGYLSALFDNNHRTWHDKISNTYVIKDN